MFAALANIYDINVARGCLLHLQQAVTVGRDIPPVNDKHSLLGIEFITWILNCPGANIRAIGCRRKVMDLRRRKVIVCQRCVSPHRRSITPVNSPLTSGKNARWQCYERINLKHPTRTQINTFTQIAEEVLNLYLGTGEGSGNHFNG